MNAHLNSSIWKVCRQWNAVALDANLWLTLAPIAWISSLKDEEMRGASWPNIETMETDSMVSAPLDRDVGDRFTSLESDDSDSIGKGTLGRLGSHSTVHQSLFTPYFSSHNQQTKLSQVSMDPVRKAIPVLNESSPPSRLSLTD